MALAHEGNPKQESATLTVKTGELISPATLTPQFFGGGGGQITPTPVDNPSGGGCGDCSDAIATSVRHPVDCAIDDIYEVYTAGSYAPATPMTGSHPGCDVGNGSSGVDVTMNITVASSINGCPAAGFTLWKATPRFGAAEFTEFTLCFVAPTTGTPITGLCAAVQPGSTVCNFTGYVVLLDYKNQIVTLGQYINANILTTQPTALATTTLPSSLPNVVAMDWFDDGIHQPYIKYFDDNFNGQTVQANITSGLIPAVSNVGVIWIGNISTVTDSAQWSSDFNGTAVGGIFVD